MGLEIIMLSEARQRKKISYDIVYMWNQKIKDTNERISKQKQTQRHRKQIYGYQRGEG